MPGSAEFESGTRSGAPLLVARGEIDLAVAPLFRDALQKLIEAATSPALVDLSAITFMDSSGVDVLVSMQRQADGAGVELILVEPSRPVQRVLELTGLWSQFTYEITPR